MHRYTAADILSCGEVSRATFIGMSWQKHAATFRGWQNFEEIRYMLQGTGSDGVV